MTSSVGNEYAVLSAGGEIENIILTSKTLDEVQAVIRAPRTVQPLSEVSEDVLRRYQYFTQRP